MKTHYNLSYRLKACGYKSLYFGTTEVEEVDCARCLVYLVSRSMATVKGLVSEPS